MLCQMVFMLEGLGAKSAGKGSLAGVFIFVTCKGAVLGEDLAALVADVPTSSDRCRRWNPMLWLCRPAVLKSVSFFIGSWVAFKAATAVEG